MLEEDSFARKFYEQAGIWGDNVAGEARVPVTLAMIPDDVQSVLDVGCGDGTMLESFDRAAKKVGLDITQSALRSLRTADRILGSSAALPLKDKQFDIVLCTEVLEHLPQNAFHDTCIELPRVACKYILISVPFREDLAVKQARCTECGHAYHIHLHLRSFDMVKLEDLFPHFTLWNNRFSGPLVRTCPSLLLKIRRKYGKRWEWDNNALCPKCGFKSDQPPHRSSISVLTSLLAQLIGERHPKWVSALYVRQ